MRAKQVYEFIQNKSLKNNIGDEIGIYNILKKKTEEWLEEWVDGFKKWKPEHRKLIYEFIPSENKLILNYDLNFCCKTITEFPFDSIIFKNHHTLNLNYSNIEKLPNEIIAENLFLSECKNLKELPNKLKINSTLNADGTNITKIPENLDLETLNLTNTKIKEIPESLQIKYNLILKGTMISIYNIPEHLRNKIIM